MAFESKPKQPSVSPSGKKTSTVPEELKNLQLSGRDGVEISVSTAALDRGMLMAAMTPQPAAAFRRLAGAETLSDAEIMLRAKAGDQSAFDYLVQKYRRPMVSFMYRMARNCGRSRRPGAGSFLARVPLAGEL